MHETAGKIARKGRGALGNPRNRYEATETVAVDDGWGEDPAPRIVRTSVIRDSSRTAIARNNSPDVPFDRSVNPYRGCEHGCIYCFARPTHAWLGYSPGLDFETKILVKPHAPKLLARELAKPGYRCATLAMGTNTDPYQPLEREHRITRAILEVLAAHEHPVGIVTKSALIQRDLDILVPMAEKRLARAYVSVTTLDRKLARIMEPRAATPERRLETIEALNAAGLPCGVLVAPMIPALNDHELEAILEACAARGAASAGYVLLRLPLEIKELFEDWLREHVPDRADRVLHLVRQTRGGALYQDQWGVRQKGTGVYATLLGRRFVAACKRLGLNEKNWDLDTSRFHVPDAAPSDQLSLL
jgi:DNA repair photolyase